MARVLVRFDHIAGFIANANHRFELDQGGQRFIRTHDETLSIVPIGSYRIDPNGTR
jgi:hypothetical protein